MIDQGRPLTDRQYWEEYYQGKATGKKLLKCHGILDRHLKELLGECLTDRGPGQRLLEFGCGNSNWLPYFAGNFGFRVSGIDYSEKGFELAKEKLLSCGLSGDIHLLDFFTLPTGFTGSFDVVLSFGVVEHFQNPSQVLRMFAETLKPGGFLATMVPKMTGLQGRMRHWSHPESYRKHCALPLSGYVGEHKRAGLEIISAREIGLTTLGLNLRDRSILGPLYGAYIKLLNRGFKGLVSHNLVHKWGVGSGFLIMATKKSIQEKEG